jgi:hypothetical protein
MMQYTEYEDEDALEITVGFATQVAWTTADDVYVHTGDTSEREDGFVWIGQLSWEDNDDPCDDYGFNVQRLRDFVIQHEKVGKAK